MKQDKHFKNIYTFHIESNIKKIELIPSNYLNESKIDNRCNMIIYRSSTCQLA